MKTCFLFPGQGAQYPGMGKDLWEASDGVKRLFDEASESCGVDMKRLLFEGSEEELKATDKTQIAVTLANAAARSGASSPTASPGSASGSTRRCTRPGFSNCVICFPSSRPGGSSWRRPAGPWTPGPKPRRVWPRSSE